MKYSIKTELYDETYNVIKCIQKVENDSYVDVSNDYFCDSLVFEYLKGKKNLGIEIAKANTIISLKELVELKAKESDIEIADHTEYLVGIVKDTLEKRKYLRYLRYTNIHETYDPEYFLPCTKEIFDKLSEHSYQAKLIFANVHVPLNTEFLDEKVNISTRFEDNFENISEAELIESHNVEIFKKYIMYCARKLITDRASGYFNILFYDFQVSNSILSSNGFFITEQNREEKYIEIVEKDDEELLDVLRSYLEAMDNLNEPLFYYKKYKEFREAIDQADPSIEKYQEMLEEFYSNFK